MSDKKEIQRQEMIKRFGTDCLTVNVTLHLTHQEMLDLIGAECEDYEPQCEICSQWLSWNKTGKATVAVDREELIQILSEEADCQHPCEDDEDEEPSWSLEIYDRYGNRQYVEDYFDSSSDAIEVMKKWLQKSEPKSVAWVCERSEDGDIGYERLYFYTDEQGAIHQGELEFEDCQHPNAVETGNYEPATWYCPDCQTSFIAPIL